MKEDDDGHFAYAVESEDTRLMNRIVEKLLLGVDISEVFSPKRICKEAKSLGLASGFSFGLSTGWDFNRAEDREACERYIRTQRPLLLVGSPPCTAFTLIQNLNWGRSFECDRRLRRELLRGVRHLEFMSRLYELQVRSGRYILHEHPQGRRAGTWAV